ncbi:MAG: DTW domain-containing protein [Proteobacteria bacterium]|nr:DTW domain-containing protein [Pseudomonadota bacterium]
MTEPRPTCFTCRRPQPVCVCSLIVPVANRTPITILQHPGERGHAFNSVRLAKLGLTDASVHLAWPDANGQMHKEVPRTERMALLYPREDAVDLADIPVSERPDHLVVLDGTWQQARRLYRDNPWLQELRHVALSPAKPSQYRIRKEPAPHCLSTIESIAAALRILEPETSGLDTLLDGFLAMVNTQAEVPHAAVSRYRGKHKPTRLDRLVLSGDRLVICYGESVGLRGHKPTLLQWTAVRPSTGEVFESQLHAPDVHDGQRLKRSMDPARAESRAQFKERWVAWVGEEPVMASWGANQAELLRSATGLRPEHLPLRVIYGNYNGGLGGTFSEIMEREGLAAMRYPVAGRAAERLGNATAMAMYLRERRQETLRRRAELEA